MTTTTLDPGSSLFFKLTIDGQDLGLFNQCEGLSAEVEVYQHKEGGNNGYTTFLPGRVTRVEGAAAEAVLPDGTLVPDLQRPGLKSGDAVSIMIRPDQFKIVRPDAAASVPRLPVSVVDTTFLGSIIHILAKTRWGEEVALRSPADGLGQALPARGEDIVLSWAAASEKVFQAT